MKLFVTCPFGLSSLLGNELKRLDIKPFKSFEKGCFVETDKRGLYQINLRSRIANKVYLSLLSGEAKTFDQLFDLLSSFGAFSEYFTSPDDISLTVVSKKSQLSSTRAIQSIAHKAIIQKLKPTTRHSSHQKELLLFIENDHCEVFLNTSGTALYQRGYRLQTGEAPLKENLAAALILLTGRKFKEALLDPFCGSGTLLIEAAMLAKNLAPGRLRAFTFQEFEGYDTDLWRSLIFEAEKKVFDGKYLLFGTDQDKEVLSFASTNAERAGVSDCITFNQETFPESLCLPSVERIITNPPYGKRLETDNIQKLYLDLASTMKTKKGGVISTYEPFEIGLDLSQRTKKSLFNGADESRFRYKKI